MKTGSGNDFRVLDAWPDLMRAGGERFAETALLPVMTRQVASPLGVLEPSHSRHRVGRGRPDEESRRRVTRISRAQPSPDSETGTHAAFIQGFQGQCPIACDGRGDNPVSPVSPTHGRIGGAYNSMWTIRGKGQRGLKHSRVKFGNRSLTPFPEYPTFSIPRRCRRHGPGESVTRGDRRRSDEELETLLRRSPARANARRVQPPEPRKRCFASRPFQPQGSQAGETGARRPRSHPSDAPAPSSNGRPRHIGAERSEAIASGVQRRTPRSRWLNAPGWAF